MFDTRHTQHKFPFANTLKEYGYKIWQVDYSCEEDLVGMEGTGHPTKGISYLIISDVTSEASHLSTMHSGFTEKDEHEYI